MKPGQVNIVTGDSGTGKSSLSTIVDYCLGRETYLIPEGIGRNVSWFGLLLQFSGDQIFIARANPSLGKISANSVYIEQGDKIFSPARTPETINTTIDALTTMLTNKVGIAPNLHIPPPGQTRAPLAATIRHAIFYCIQEQGEIAAKKILFHRQEEHFVFQAIKDTLPYFLGAIQEDRLALERELSRARTELRRTRKALKDIENIQGEGEIKAQALFAEAQEVGLISTEKTPQNFEDLVSILQNTTSWLPQNDFFIGSSNLAEFQDELKSLQNQFREVSDAIRDAVTFAQEAEGYTSELQQQELRLASIGLFDSHIQITEICPVCTQPMATHLPTVDNIRHSIEHLQANLRLTTREQPRLRQHIDTLENQRTSLKQSIKEKNEVIRSILQEGDIARRFRDTNASRMRVIGRISLWLESISVRENTVSLQEAVQKAEARVADLDKQLDPEDKEERLSSILNRIGQQISQWAEDLKLEYSGDPVRFDAKKLTVVVDTPNGVLPLARIGSAQNWLGYHLAVLLALHKHFNRQSRPIPHFLFLDQPSQVYYPPYQEPDRDDSLGRLSNTDREALRRIFKLIFDVVKDLAPNFQIILTEHADLKDDVQFQEAVVERWRQGVALIPPEWISDF